MELRHLRCFLAVAEEPYFTRTVLLPLVSKREEHYAGQRPRNGRTNWPLNENRCQYFDGGKRASSEVVPIGAPSNASYHSPRVSYSPPTRCLLLENGSRPEYPRLGPELTCEQWRHRAEPESFEFEIISALDRDDFVGGVACANSCIQSYRPHQKGSPD